MHTGLAADLYFLGDFSHALSSKPPIECLMSSIVFSMTKSSSFCSNYSFFLGVLKKCIGVSQTRTLDKDKFQQPEQEPGSECPSLSGAGSL